MSTQSGFLDRHRQVHPSRARRRGPELAVLILFVALLAVQIALVLYFAPAVDPSTVIYGGT